MRRLMVAGLWAAGCTAPSAPAQQPPPVAETSAAADPVRADVPPPPAVVPDLGAPPQPPQPTAPTFDATTVTSIDARIVEIYTRAAWVPCGVLHAVGAIRVEVLGLGEPPPQMVLYVSCPADIPHRDLLKVGTRIHAQLHRRRQPWPKPPEDLPEGVPVRDVKTLTGP